ncbi:DUF3843 family protein [uncultured Bacteroides sp.]|uniref:DUF3843 family protein n=1 Tax=uncultured Bacteroides sp. TaxID=162156 RepID=UPI002592F5BC|nr:DUF3843 family protein [uncultured Bacteroides sp.]
MNKLYTKDWLKLHPYKQVDSVDQYYTKIANQIYLILKKTLQDKNTEFMGDLSLRIAAWFEDVISRTGIWETFTEQCERLYGSRLPFYPLGDDYYPDEVNVEDIRFLLWHFYQRQITGEALNPENPGIAEAADKIFALLSKEYERAPENERMKAYFSDYEPVDCLYYDYLLRVIWFHYRCYLNWGNLEELFQYTDDLEFAYEDKSDEKIDEWRSDRIFDVSYGKLAMTSRNSLLSLTTPEWLYLIWKRNGVDMRLLEEAKVFDTNYYRVVEKPEGGLIVERLCGEYCLLAVTRMSLPDYMRNKTFAVGEVLKCDLVKFGECCWLYGDIQCGELQDFIPEMEVLREKLSGEAKRAEFLDFLHATDYKPFIFCKDKDEVRSFLTEKMKMQMKDGIEDKTKYIGTGGAVLMASPQSGLVVLDEFVECICLPDNPYYDQKEAEEHGFMFFVEPDLLPYELSCLLQDCGALSEACLGSSIGIEHAKAFLHANAQFVTDYFFHKRREKDFSDSWNLKKEDSSDNE